MKVLSPHAIDPSRARVEWNDYKTLLASNGVLSERNDVLPFFKQRHDLSMLICNYFPKIKKPNVVAHEYQIYGDFAADLIVGDSTVHHYLLVEFEDGSPESVFKQSGRKATPDWARRFEGAYSQLVDWLWKLEDMRSTADFQNTFGNRRASFQGLIIIGKDMVLAPQEQDRLRWRMDKTLIDSNAISTVSFDDLAVDLDFWLNTYYGV